MCAGTLIFSFSLKVETYNALTDTQLLTSLFVYILAEKRHWLYPFHHPHHVHERTMYVFFVDAFWKIILKPQNDCVIAHLVSGQILTVVPRPVNVEFVVDKGKVSPEFLDFPHQLPLHQMFPVSHVLSGAGTMGSFKGPSIKGFSIIPP
jgi:hypothetical protein